MIVTIGNNCKVSEQLRHLGIRKEAYPFDWLLFDNHKKGIKLVTDIMDLDNSDVEIFCQTHLTPPSTEYNIRFPHDDTDSPDNLQKYIRRVNRFRNVFNISTYVILIYVSRDNTFDDELYELYDKLSSLRKNVYLYSVNGFKNVIKPEYKDKIFSFNIGYVLRNGKNDWIHYDKTTYRHNLNENFTKNIPLIKKKIENFIKSQVSV
jgi:hypothetical protein